MAIPNEFDYTREGELYPGLSGKNTAAEFDYTRAGEPLPTLTAAGVANFTVALTGTSTLAAGTQPYLKFTSTITGSSTLAPTFSPYLKFTVATAGTSTLTATPHTITPATITGGGDDRLYYHALHQQHAAEQQLAPRIPTRTKTYHDHVHGTSHPTGHATTTLYRDEAEELLLLNIL